MKSQLKNWSFGAVGVTSYTPPEMIAPRLQGDVYNHPKSKRHYDGKSIITSRVIGKRNGLVVTQSGSEYELLDADPNYEKEFPGAKDRLFKQLAEV